MSGKIGQELNWIHFLGKIIFGFDRGYMKDDDDDDVDKAVPTFCITWWYVVESKALVEPGAIFAVA